MINTQLINDFRNKVNKNDWVFFKYRRNKDKNQWNCICSAMDWIEMTANHIAKHPLKRGESDGIAVLTFIMCIDIIVEAIEQLHRVFFSEDTRIFENDNDCFPNNIFHFNDRKYFKHIRSCFGAHPVNIDDTDFPGDKTFRRFASWSGSFLTGDCSVLLYSNIIDKDNISLNIYFDQLQLFAEKYYNYLTVLEKEITDQYNSFCQMKKQEVIICTGDPLTKLSILLEESKKRLDNSYYQSCIEQLIVIYQTPISCKQNLPLVEQYRCFLLQFIDRIQNELQKMTFGNIDFDEYDPSIPLPNGWGYYYEKIVGSAFGNDKSLFIWENKIHDIFSPFFVTEYKSPQELYVLATAAIHQLSTQKIQELNHGT